MKILAIRGSNLASLAGRFEVDFQAQPLAGAGLYAITGPTGAGKSTLLDALCLALYENTPRLVRARGGAVPDVGEHTVGHADPRTLLRRGAGEGHAEVDFVGSDEVAYRACWRVRRARGRPDGRLQPSELQLTRLADGQRLGDGGKLDTLRQIALRVGLDFEQFTRAVLLAQNDFATFLKAGDDERAELLQTLTGTQTYSRLSVQAFERAKAENEALARLEAEWAGLPLLDDAVREARLAQRAAGLERLAGLAREQAELDAALGWQQTAARLAAQVADAQARQTQAEAAWVAAGERRDRLARLEAVQAARPLVAELTRLTGALDEGRQAQAALVERLAQADARREAARCALAGANQALAAAEQARTQALPELATARALDAHLGELAAALSMAEASQADAVQALGAAQARCAALEAEEAACRRALADDRQWLAEQAGLATLADGWPRWEVLLDQAAEVRDAVRAADGRLRAQVRHAGALAQALAQAEAVLAQARQAQEQAAAGLDAAVAACGAVDAEGWLRQRQHWDSERAACRDALQCLQERSHRAQACEALQARQAGIAAALAEANGTRQACEAALPAAGARLAQAQKALEAALNAAGEGAVRLRAGLVDGDPCPVCGATEHPYAHRDARLDAVLAVLRTGQAGARHEWNTLHETHVREAARVQALTAQAHALTGQLEEAGAALQAAQRAWQAHRLAARLAGQADPLSALQAQAGVAEAEGARLEAEAAAFQAALAARAQAQAGLQQAQASLARAREQHAQADYADREARQAGRALAETHEGLSARLAGLLADLAAAWPGQPWQAHWQADPATFVASQREAVQCWRQRVRAVEAGQAALAQCAVARQAAAEAQRTAQAHAQARTDEAGRLQRQYVARRQAREACLGGEPLVTVEARLEAALEAARTALGQAQAASRLADGEHARLDEALRGARERQAAQQAACERADAALTAWLRQPGAGPDAVAADLARAPEGLARADLFALLAVSPAALQAERQALQGIEQALAGARAVLAEHRQADARHQAGPRPGPAGDGKALAAHQAALAERIAQCREADAALRLILARDDECRAQAQALAARRADQAARAHLWRQLGELIGSADGKKFRNFAQQLTLDILLEQANRHLGGLSRRYGLERIRDSLGLLVIDRDMGDEVRSVHSLSGGESFLVSLALALGLASLSAHRVRVESLFIDEGFGSLDAEALRVAMDALDGLQAQGRKVGVISHVQDMTERIATRIQLKRLAGGLSRVVVSGG